MTNKRAIAVAAHIGKSISRCPLDKAHAVLCLNLVKLGRARGSAWQEYLGQFLNLDTAWRYKTAKQPGL
jgi:hypothetical protein